MRIKLRSVSAGNPTPPHVTSQPNGHEKAKVRKAIDVLVEVCDAVFDLDAVGVQLLQVRLVHIRDSCSYQQASKQADTSEQDTERHKSRNKKTTRATRKQARTVISVVLVFEVFPAPRSEVLRELEHKDAVRHCCGRFFARKKNEHRRAGEKTERDTREKVHERHIKSAQARKKNKKKKKTGNAKTKQQNRRDALERVPSDSFSHVRSFVRSFVLLL